MIQGIPISKPTRLFFLVLALSFPIQADVSYMQPIASVSQTSKTRALEGSIDLGNDGRLLFGPSLELVQSKTTNHLDLRFHVNTWLYGRPRLGDEDPDFAPFAQFSIMASAGGITGWGLGGRAAIGVRIKHVSLNAFATCIQGRANPWDGSKRTYDRGLQIGYHF